MVGLGLARVADDEVGSEGGRRLDGADGLDPLEEALAVAPPPHASHQRRRHVLQREVEVGDPGGQDRLDQLVGQVARVQVEQPDPRHPLGDGSHEGHDGALAHALVPAVGGQVLGHEDDLRGPELIDLGQQVVDRSAALLAPERRDGAEAAGAVAALGDLEIGPRRGGAGPGQVEQVERRHRRPGLGADGHRHRGRSAGPPPPPRSRPPRRSRAGPRPTRPRSARPCTRSPPPWPRRPGHR